MKQFTEKQMQCKVEAHNECLDLIANGYIKRVDFCFGESWVVSMVHRENGNKITMFWNRRGYRLVKNGKEIKRVHT